MIVGIAGTLGAGKGTVVDYLKSKGYRHYSSSGTLKRILTERGLPHDREHMSQLAEELVRMHEGGVLGMNMAQAEMDGAENVVLEAIHRMSEADFIRSRGGKIWGIDADPKVRFERTVLARGDGEKDSVTFERFQESIAREEEGKRDVSSNIREVLKTAEVIILNNGTKQELDKEIEAALWN